MKKNRQTVLQEAAKVVREESRRKEKQSKTSHQLEMARFAQRTQKNLHQSAKVVRTGQKKAPKSTKGLVKRVEERLNPGSDLAKWAKMLSEPFKFEGFFCPVNYNPVPSFIQSTARTTATNLNYSVGGGWSAQIALYPGHGQISDSISQTSLAGAGPMDGVSYHGQDVYVGGGAVANQYVVGPMAKTDNISTKTPIIGAITAVNSLNITTGTLNTVASTPITYDVALPYLSQTAGTNVAGHHSRWQLVAMGVRIHNVSPEIYRGGVVISVQPNNNYHPSGGAVTLLEVFPTFKDHGVGESVEISWIPRADDLAFWHGADAETSGHANPYLQNPAILIFIENNTSNTMSYSYEIVCHWQLAGTYLNPVGGPAPHAPEVKPAVEKTLSFLQNNSHTAQQALSLVNKAVSHSGSSSGSTWSDYARAGFSVMKHVAGAL